MAALSRSTARDPTAPCARSPERARHRPCRTRESTDRDFYRSLGLGRGLFFDEETCGADRLLVAGGAPWMQVLAQSPLSPQAQTDIAASRKRDRLLSGLSSEEEGATVEDELSGISC
jgi:hypothetical protein